MAKITSSIHRDDVFGSQLRYFSSPIYDETNQPDMPWHVFDDLMRILELDQEATTYLLRKLRGDWPEPRTVATSEGLLTIAPHFMAEGLLMAIGRSRKLRPENFLKIRGAYRRNLTEALKQMIPNYDPIGRMLFALSSMSEEGADAS